MTERICAIGDSIVYGRAAETGKGWVEQLREAHVSREPRTNAVFNLGIGGNTTEELLRRLNPECAARKATIILIGVGVNDSRRDNWPQAPQRVERGAFKANLVQLLIQAKTLTPKVAVVGMVPVDEARTCPIGGHHHLRADQATYAEATARTCRDQAVTYIDIFGLWSEDFRPSDLADGLHPNANGHLRLFRDIERVLTDLRWIG